MDHQASTFVINGFFKSRDIVIGFCSRQFRATNRVESVFNLIAAGLTLVPDIHDLEPPFNRLSSEQPNIPEQNVDLIHRPIGFGRWAMPKLRRELSNNDDNVVICAIETITELVIDPEKAFQAINLKIIERMMNLLVAENPVIRERTALALSTMGKFTKAREIIANNKELLNNISIVIEDPYEEVRLHVAKLLETVAEFWKAADELIDFGYIPILLHIIQGNEEKYIILIHLRTLKFLMYNVHGKMLALDNFGFNIFLKFLHEENSELVGEALSCISQLTATCEGEKLAREENLLGILNVLLHDERPEIHTQAASVIMFCTVKATGKIMAPKYPTMTPRLIQLAQNRFNRSTQMFAIKALTNICENPQVKKRVNREFGPELSLIQVGNDENIKTWKEQLLSVVNWNP